MAVKEQALSGISGLPDNAFLEDAVIKLLFINKINRGLKDYEEGRVVSHEHIKNKFGR
jgi:predicted transcriptional regulator